MTTQLVCWPDRLPFPSVQYSYQPKASYVRTDMDAGRPRVRRRFLKTPTTVALQWSLTQEQLELFEGFVFHDLLGGIAWFVMPIANGRGINRVKVRFSQPDSPYQVSLVAPDREWTVTAQAETMGMPVLSADAYWVALNMGERTFADAESDLRQLVNVDLPGRLIW